MQFRDATINDIDEVLALHFKYQIDSISHDDKADGFITTNFTKDHLTNLIENEKGLFLAIKDNKIVAYVMSASWQYWSTWPIFAHMIEALPKLQYQGVQLTMENSYQYGPVCVDKCVRGSGVFEQLFEFALSRMSSRYLILVTFINKINPRSFSAHTKKTKLDIISEFEFNNNQYYELACMTKRATNK